MGTVDVVGKKRPGRKESGEGITGPESDVLNDKGDRNCRHKLEADSTEPVNHWPHGPHQLLGDRIRGKVTSGPISRVRMC